MMKHIKDEKWKDFIKDFERNPEKWYKDQVKNDWEFDEETQIRIVEECFYVKDYIPSIKYIKNSSKETRLKAIEINTLSIKYIENLSEEICISVIKNSFSSIMNIPKKNQSFDIVQTFFDCSKSDRNREDYYEYLSKKFITKYQALIMIQDDPKYIKLVSRNIQKELIEMKPELEKYLDKEEIEKDINDFF